LHLARQLKTSSTHGSSAPHHQHETCTCTIVHGQHHQTDHHQHYHKSRRVSRNDASSPCGSHHCPPHRLKLPPTSTRTGRCCRRLRRPALATAGRCPHLTRASCARSGRRRPWPRLLAPFAPHEPAAATAARVVHCGSPPPDLLAAQPPDLGKLGLDP
jgi:hypothetical protein